MELAVVAIVSGEPPEHLVRVARLACGLARALGLDPRTTARIGQAGWLHDVGMAAVPRGVIRKPGPLTAREQAAVRRHAALGSELLRRVRLHPLVLQAVRHHHERWDGSGYPDRLQSTAIPLAARILAVADTFDALTTPRPYRPAPLGVADALAELRRRSGVHFDPQVVQALEEALRRPELQPQRLRALHVPPFPDRPARQPAPGVQALMDSLVELLGNPEGDLRDAAAWVLWSLGPRAVGALARGLRHPDDAVNWRCAQLLKTMRPAIEVAVPWYVGRLTDPQPAVRAEAARALALLGSAARPAIPALRQARKDLDPAVRSAASATLAALEGQLK